MIEKLIYAIHPYLCKLGYFFIARHLCCDLDITTHPVGSGIRVGWDVGEVVHSGPHWIIFKIHKD